MVGVAFRGLKGLCGAFGCYRMLEQGLKLNGASFLSTHCSGYQLGSPHNERLVVFRCLY